MNRRAFPRRFNTIFKVGIRPDAHGFQPIIPIEEVKGLSQNGIGIYFDKPLDIGKEVVLEIDPIWGKVYSIQSVVKSVREEEGRYFIGLEFNKRISYKDLSRFVQ